jgi:hypothetical protein
MPALLRYTSERRWLRRADRDFCRLFPYVPGRSGYGKRLRAASSLLTSMIRILARDTSLRGDDVWLVDSNGPVSDLGSDEGPEYLWSHENSNGTSCWTQTDPPCFHLARRPQARPSGCPAI